MDISIKNNLINNVKAVSKEDPYEKIANAMEKQFAEYLLKQMQKTIGKNNDNNEVKYYKGLLNSQYAKALSQSDTLGIKEMILKQIKPDVQKVYNIKLKE